MVLPIKVNRLQETMLEPKSSSSSSGGVGGAATDLLDDIRNPEKNMFIHGFSSIKQEHYGKHPLEASERTYRDRQQYTDLVMLRKVQGLHAPMRLLFERKAVAKTGHLPFLPRSNFAEEVLDGRDEMVLPEDILQNPREFPEVNLPPHMVMERQLGIL